VRTRPEALSYDADLKTKEQRFETDLSIFEDGTPRLVIEIKYETVSTHGLMYTNDKADYQKQCAFHQISSIFLLTIRSGLLIK